MPKCTQCDTPAVAVMADQPLCVHHLSVMQAIMDRQMAHLNKQAEDALEQMEMVTGIRLPRRPRPPTVNVSPTFHNINIKDSSVGVVQSGGSLKQVDVAISVLGQAGEAGLAAALKTLSEAAMNSSALDQRSKDEGAEMLAALAQETAAKKGERKSGVARALLHRLKEILGVTADAARTAGGIAEAFDTISAAFGG
jgi:hypothetical protein